MRSLLGLDVRRGRPGRAEDRIDPLARPLTGARARPAVRAPDGGAPPAGVLRNVRLAPLAQLADGVAASKTQ
jgi:hypothetical protein